MVIRLINSNSTDLIAPEPAIPSAAAPVQSAPRTSLTKRPFMDSEEESDAESDASDSFRPRTTFAPSPATFQPISSNTLHFPVQPQTAQAHKLFTTEELAVLPAGVLDRKKAKSLAKKAKKRRAAVERTEGELMAGFMDMDMEEPEAREEMETQMPTFEQKSKKDKRKAKKETQAKQRKETTKMAAEMEIDEDARKEAEFASFLANMGGKCLGSNQTSNSS